MRNNRKSLCVTVFAVFFGLQPLLAQFKPALPGYRYEFPRDYFNHPDFETEWWYYTGNLQSTDGRKFGFELTFFREGVNRDNTHASTWDVRDLYLAHFAISDLDRKKFFHAERTNRSGPGIAGADAAIEKVWNGNWSVFWKDGGETLTAIADQFAMNLTLQPQKPPVIHGQRGISKKSARTGRASHYFSQTRLRASGALEIASNKFAVTGLAWMDHEFFTQQVDSDQQGWDWFSLQLDDDTELMLFQIRRKDGSIEPLSAGTFVDEKGVAHQLTRNDFELETLPATAGNTWTSSATQASYPVRWQIRVPSLGILLEASTPLPSQEITSNSQIVPNYWEGAIFLTGSKGATQPLHGSGYLEMTGYDHKINMP
jgi:predicted secreted hydrolase